MIASDLNNPDFVGARNPDAGLSVRFYTKPIQNNFESETQGRPIFSDVDMVRIDLPGDDKTVIDTIAREDHKRRFPQHWAHYKNKMEGEQHMVGKTPLSAWARVSPAVAEELRHMKFYAVEDVANASDMQLQRLGMVAGMGPHAFRDAAQAYLRLAAGEAQETKISAALAESKQENETMRQQMATMQAQLAALAARGADEVKADAPPAPTDTAAFAASLNNPPAKRTK